MKRLASSLIFGVTLVLVGCGAESPKRSSPQAVLSAAVQTADHSIIVATPQVDILFVVDNSWSMLKYQERLASNISSFVDEFSAKATIDYHIGVLTIWDSDPVHTTMIKDRHPKGQLIPLKIPKDQSPQNLSNPMAFQGDREDLLINGAVPPRYVTRDTPNLNVVLKSTLLLGEEKGPEFEEMFSPVDAFLKPENLNGPNSGFFRPSAHLLLIFITDANDASEKDAQSSADGASYITPGYLYQELVAAKGGNKDLLQTFAIIDPTFNSCKRDQSGPPSAFYAFTNKTGGVETSICEDFGTKLAHYARDYSTTVSRQTIQLLQMPDKDKPFTVQFGSQVIPQAIPPNYDEGWSFNPSKLQIVIGGKLKLNPEPGAQIAIKDISVDLDNLNHVHSMAPPTDAPATVTVGSTPQKP